MSSSAIMEKDLLVKKTIDSLQRHNFEVYNYSHPELDLCFELLVRHHKLSLPTLLLKFCENIDRIKPHTNQELKLLSLVLSAIPILIGQKNRRAKLQDDVIYERERILVVNEKTFETIIKSPRYPFAIAKRGGYFQEIDGERLKLLRKKKDYSQAELGKRIGVSRKSIASYENIGMRASIEHVEKIKAILDENIVLPLDFYKYIRNRLENTIEIMKIDLNYQRRFNKNSIEFIKLVDEIVEDTGFRTFWPKSTPMDILIYEDNEETHEINRIMFFGGTYFQGKNQIVSIHHEKFLEKEIPDSNQKGIIYEEDLLNKNKMKVHTLPYLTPKELKLLENPNEFKNLMYRKIMRLSNRN